MNQPNQSGPGVSARTIAKHLEHAGAAALELAAPTSPVTSAGPPAANRAAQMLAWAREAYSYEAVRLLCEAARICLAGIPAFSDQVDFSFGRPGSYANHLERLELLRIRMPGSTRIDPVPQKGHGVPNARQCVETALRIDRASPWAALYSALIHKAEHDNTAAVAQLLRLTKSPMDRSGLHHTYRNMLSCLVDSERSAELAPFVIEAEAIAPDDAAWAFYRLALAATNSDARAFMASRERLIAQCTDVDRTYWAESVALHVDGWARDLGSSSEELILAFGELGR